MRITCDFNKNVDEKDFGKGFIVVLLLATVLNPLNSSLIATALVSIAEHFQVNAEQTALLVSSLYLVSAICQPLMGRLSAVWGAITVFRSGLILVVIGGLLGWVAKDFSWLIASRIIIGLGTSAAYPSTMVMLQSRAEYIKRPVPLNVLGALAASGHISAALGLPIGGALTALLGWQAIFAINIPLALLALIGTIVCFPKGLTGFDERGINLSETRLDFTGFILFSGTITSLLFFLKNLASPSWGFLILFVFLLVVLVFVERNRNMPFIDVRQLAKNGALLRTYLRLVLIFTVMYTTLYGVGQWLEQARGVDVGEVGLIIMPLSIASAVSSLIISRWSWIRSVLVLSSVLISVGGFFLCMAIKQPFNLYWIFLALTLFGIAMGISNVSNQSMLYLNSSKAELGVNSGFYRTASYIGGFLATGMIGALFKVQASDAGIMIFSEIFFSLGIILLILSLLDKKIPIRA